MSFARTKGKHSLSTSEERMEYEALNQELACDGLRNNSLASHRPVE